MKKIITLAVAGIFLAFGFAAAVDAKSTVKKPGYQKKTPKMPKEAYKEGAAGGGAITGKVSYGSLVLAH